METIRFKTQDRAPRQGERLKGQQQGVDKNNYQPKYLGAAEGVENPLRCHRRRHRHEPPRQELGVAGHVGVLAQQLPGALDPESPEPAEDLVVDDRHPAGATLLNFFLSKTM